MQLCIFEDAQYANFQPLVYFRPVYDLRCGALTTREKIAVLLPRVKTALHLRKELEEYHREENPSILINQLDEEDTWFINGRIVADDRLARLVRKHAGHREIAFCQNDEVCAAFVRGRTVSRIANHLGAPLTKETFRGIPYEEAPVGMMRYLWDVVHNASTAIEIDFQLLVKKRSGRTFNGKIYPGSHLVQKKNIILGNGSIVKPGVVLDAERGPIIIGTGVTLMPNAVIEGPASIGDRTVVKVGAKIYHGTSIGRECKVGGEVEASIVQSYTNKQHDGFLGHSYLGSWVNIGADTNTSDLKNTYGSVKVQLELERIDTGMQFVGVMMGDHSKTGINVMFDSGTVVGVSCNVYGAGLPPKFVPGFSWGDGKSLSVYDLEKGLETARRVLLRRDVTMTDAYERLYRHVFAATRRSRKKAGVA